MPDGPAWLLGEALPVELMNTLWTDRDGRHDQLATSAGAAAFLSAHQPALPLPVDAVPGRALADLRRLRDALRRLAALTVGDDRDSDPSPVPDAAAAVEIVNRCAATAPRWSGLAWPAAGAPRREAHAAGGPAQAAVAGIAEQAVELFTGPLRERLRACRAPGCLLYFVASHPRREWCSDACGNRVRVARHYRSRHPAPD
jgi:predicted RNA-binding Zn ribbon-like protein